MWSAEAPANIALIKYMGKKERNIPCNASLSYSLNKFRTKVILELAENDIFENSLNLSEQAVNRFLNHLKYIKDITGCTSKFLIKSENNFPHSSGIASSASSFAALTLCAFKAICEIQKVPLLSLEEMSQISRIASGSSCRSFFSDWVMWEGNSIKTLKLPPLLHNLILVDSSVKEKSSSEAHKLVRTSLFFLGRAERANLRLTNLISALTDNKWYDAYQICWEEFWDMHHLFETSNSSFRYMTSNTLQVLNYIQNFWKEHKDGPIATIDAGPNVHLLWRKNQKFFKQIFTEFVAEKFKIF